MELRDYQMEAFEALKSSFLNGDGKGLLVLATGLGKTVVAEAFLQWLFENQHITKCAVLCHLSAGTDQLVRKFTESTFVGDQTVARYESEEDLKASIVCTTYHKVFQAKDFPFESFNLVIADEAHHTPATMFSLVTESFSKVVYRLGLTATPFRLDRQPLTELFGETVYEQDLLWGVEHGWLAKMAYWSIASHLNSDILNELEASGQKISLKEINRQLFDQADPLKVWDELQERCPGEQAIIFCRSIEHAKAVQAAFESQEPGCSALISSKKSKDANQRSLNAYGSGVKQYLIGIDMPIEMLDFPNTSVIVLWRVSQSLRIFLQSLGRGLRKHEGKEQLTVLDFVGFAENVNPWSEYADFSGFEDADEVEGVGRRVEIVPGLTLWGDVSYVEMISKVESLLSRLTVADLKDHPIGHVLFPAFDRKDHGLTWGSGQVVRLKCQNPQCSVGTFEMLVIQFTGGPNLKQDQMLYPSCCGFHAIKGQQARVWTLKNREGGEKLLPYFSNDQLQLELASNKQINLVCQNQDCRGGYFRMTVYQFTGGPLQDVSKIRYPKCCRQHPLKEPKLMVGQLKVLQGGRELYSYFSKDDYLEELGSSKRVKLTCQNPRCRVGVFEMLIVQFTGGPSLSEAQIRYPKCCGYHPRIGQKPLVGALESFEGGGKLLPYFSKEQYGLGLASSNKVKLICQNPHCSVGSFEMTVMKFTGGLSLKKEYVGYPSCCGYHPLKGQKPVVGGLKSFPDGEKLLPYFSKEMYGLTLGSTKQVMLQCQNPQCSAGSFEMKVMYFTGGPNLKQGQMQYPSCCGFHPIKGQQARVWTLINQEGGEKLLPYFAEHQLQLELGSNQHVTLKCQNSQCSVRSFAMSVRNFTGGPSLNQDAMLYPSCCSYHPIKSYKLGYGPPKQSKDKK